MNPILFPGLNLTISVDRVACYLGTIPIYWYGIVIAAGFLLAAWYATHISRRYGLTEDNIIDMLIFALPLGILGARLYYVIFYRSLYLNGDGSFSWAKAIAIRDGGLAIYGGIIASVLTVLVFCRVKKLSVGALLDVGGFGLLIGQAVGRWGNFFNQEAHGGPTDLPWRMGICVNGAYQYVHPTFLYESLWNVIGFFLLQAISKRRKYDGQMFTLYVAWYGLGRFWIEGLRTDSLYFFDLTLFGAPVRTSQLLALVSFVIAAALLIFQLKFRTHTPDRLYVNRVTLPPKKSRNKKPQKATETSADSAASHTEQNPTPADCEDAGESKKED